MKYDQNLHTHTIYCDGKDTPEEMVQRAIELGFDSIGFSGHAPMKYPIGWAMSEKNKDAYVKDVTAISEKYKDRIKVYLGLENDVYADTDLSLYDYIISSVHFVKIGNEIFGIDCNINDVKQLIDQHFGGNGLKYAKYYYEELVKINALSRTDIVGHCDVVSKFSERENFFDVDSKEYQSFALESITAVAEKNKVFEINTGAISRGYRTTVYPAPFIMKRLKELDCKFVISSDCHNRNFLNDKFDDCLLYLKSFGINKVYKFENGKFIANKI